MDEIFGEQNFRNEIAIRRYDKNISTQFAERGVRSLAVGFERVLFYAKSYDSLFNPAYRPADEERQNQGYWKGFHNSADRPTMRYELLGVTPESGQWKWQKSVATEAVQNYSHYLANHPDISLEEHWSNTGQELRFIRRREHLSRGKNKGVEHWVPPSSGVLVLQRRFMEGWPVAGERRRGAWHGSAGPVRYYPESPPATAAVQRARTVPGAASPAPPGTLGAGLSGASFSPQACCRPSRKAPASRHRATW